MVSLADLPEAPLDGTCTHCGASITRGYVVASETVESYAFEADTAVCDTCGWTDVGATGCAPTLSDFETGDLLVRVERDEGALRPAAVTDERS
jgi:hypothetical protein